MGGWLLSLRRKQPGLAAGDTLIIGAAPFAGPNVLANIKPWVANTLLTKTVTITIPMLQFNQFLLNQPTYRSYLARFRRARRH